MSVEKSGLSQQSPEEKYKKLLSAGIGTNRTYHEIAKTLDKKGISDVRQQMESEIQERINLLRQS